MHRRVRALLEHGLGGAYHRRAHIVGKGRILAQRRRFDPQGGTAVIGSTRGGSHRPLTTRRRSSARRLPARRWSSARRLAARRHPLAARRRSSASRRAARRRSSARRSSAPREAGGCVYRLPARWLMGRRFAASVSLGGRLWVLRNDRNGSSRPAGRRPL